MAGAGDLSNNPPQALRVSSRVLRRQAFYPYPAEDPESPTTYALERKRARSLNIPWKAERPAARRYLWAPGRQPFGSLDLLTLSLKISASRRASGVSGRYTSIEFPSIALW
jgi:hypothetical protein